MPRPFMRDVYKRYPPDMQIEEHMAEKFFGIAREADIRDEIYGWVMILPKGKRMAALQDVVNQLQAEGEL